MKRHIAIVLACVIALSLALTGCNSAPADGTAGATQAPTGGNEAVDPTTTPVTGNDPVVSVPEAPKATALTLDGGYSISFSPDTLSYEVRIPDGRPRIPKISATADAGATVTVTQAVIADGQTTGAAYAVIANANGTTEYEVKFIRDASQGFHLQYHDYYTFAPQGATKFESSNSAAVTVNQKGQIYAKNLSDSPITITARSANGNEVGKLVIDKVVKAPLNIFLITGQSNAYGTYDIPANTDYLSFYNSQKALAITPAPGTVLCTDVNNLGGIENYMYDLSAGRAGFSPALGKTWYDLTGEKTLMIQTAVGGSPIEAWIKPDGATRYTYGNYASNFYETTFNTYTRCLADINSANSGYELNRVHAYWLQGETGMASSFEPNKLGAGIGDWDFGATHNILNSQAYYDLFMKNMEYFEQDFGCEFMGILLVRAVVEVCGSESLQEQLLTELVPARAAQYSLHNTNTGSNISLVSRVCDIARMETYADRTVEGWGMMGCNNLHYNQSGHNANGVAAATNTYQHLYDREGRKATDLEVIKENGRDRLAEGEELIVVAGDTYQTCAMVLPMYTDTPYVSYEVADTSVCTIDQFGLITVPATSGGKQTTITYTCAEAGLSKTITVKVATKEVTKVSYEWNFDKNDLTEKTGQNNLTVSGKTGDRADYTIANGIYTGKNSVTNFAMEKPVRISSDNDWCIEWRGQVKTNSALFGTEGNTTNFMYIAYSVPFEVENPLRLVGADGTAVMIPYGNYASYNTSGMNTWKLQYVASTKRIMLYMNNTPVGMCDMPAGWYAEFTNMFGSYVEGTNVDYMGSLDWVKVTTTNEQIIMP